MVLASSTLMCQVGEIKGILRLRRLMVVTLDWEAKGKGEMNTPTGTRRQQQQSWLTQAEHGMSSEC
jgi:hypothetical protein